MSDGENSYKVAAGDLVNQSTDFCRRSVAGANSLARSTVKPMSPGKFDEKMRLRRKLMREGFEKFDDQ